MPDITSQEKLFYGNEHIRSFQYMYQNDRSFLMCKGVATNEDKKKSFFKKFLFYFSFSRMAENEIVAVFAQAVEILVAANQIDGELSEEQRAQLNEQMQQAQEQIMNLINQPGFVLSLCQSIEAFASNDYALNFAATQIYRSIKSFWQNDELMVEKPTIRSLLLQLLFQGSDKEIYSNNLIDSIALIIDCDYPQNWPDLNKTLQDTLKSTLESESPDFSLVDVILRVAKNVCQNRDSSSRRDSSFSKFKETLAYWGDQIINLLEGFANEEFLSEPLGQQIYLHVLQVFDALISDSLDDKFLPHLQQLFTNFQWFISESGIYPIIQQIFILAQKFLFRYINEIIGAKKRIKALSRPGIQQPQQGDEEEEENEIMGAFYEFLNAILQSLADPELPIDATLEAFKAITYIIKSSYLRDPEHYMNEEIFQHLTNAIFERLSLTEEQVEDIELDPVEYFKNDIGKIDEARTPRKAAYDLMKVMSKYYREQFTELFTEIYDTSIPEQLASGQDVWVEYDKIVFFTGFIVSDKYSYRDGVLQVIEGFDLVEFVNLFILPTFTPDFPYKILQADAVKFYVDYRNVIPGGDITNPNFQLFLDMMKSTNIATKLYGAYLVEQLLTARFLNINDEFLASKDIKSIIPSLMSSLIAKSGENDVFLNQIACVLKRLLKVGAGALLEVAPLTINKLLDIIDQYQQREPKDPDFFHNIWESVAAIIVFVGIDITQVIDKIFTVLDGIIQNNSQDFIPYAIQMYGAVVQGFPEGTDIHPGLIERFTAFLDPPFWIPFGNIPALAMLISNFCTRVPDLVNANEPQILEICNNLLGNSRTHPSAFQILTSLIRKGTDNLGPIMEMVVQHLLGQEPPPKYRYGFALFLCNAASLVPSDLLLESFGHNDEVFQQWADSLSLIKMRTDLENVVAGTLKVLRESESISADQWGCLFCGLLNMLERPARDDVFKEDLQARKAEEAAATQFDTTFSRLICAEKVQLAHPELQGEDLIKYFAVSIAEISASRSEYLAHALEMTLLTPYTKQTFIGYQEKYEIQFNI